MIDAIFRYARCACTRSTPLPDFDITTGIETGRIQPPPPPPEHIAQPGRRQDRGYSVGELANGSDEPQQTIQPVYPNRAKPKGMDVREIFTGRTPDESAQQNQPQSSERIPDYF